jgi:hypothetical protein
MRCLVFIPSLKQGWLGPDKQEKALNLEKRVKTSKTIINGDILLPF